MEIAEDPRLCKAYDICDERKKCDGLGGLCGTMISRKGKGRKVQTYCESYAPKR